MTNVTTAPKKTKMIEIGYRKYEYAGYFICYESYHRANKYGIYASLKDANPVAVSGSFKSCQAIIDGLK